MTRHDIETFFRTLLLGDFEEEQNQVAQWVGGLISLVPVLDQVMDVRDISGAIFNINKHGGFATARAEQLVNLGFAGFGAIPEVGSVFKTVFKPLWKERRAAKGLVHGGTDAVERLLGMRKGSAIAWIREDLLSKWPARTQSAISAVDTALVACIDLLEFIASASGWKEWLIPDSIQAMARELLPSLKSMRSPLRQAVQRGSDEIQEFLNDLLGEQAAAVVMAVGERAVQASATPGTRSRNGHNAADVRQGGTAPSRQPGTKVQQQNKAKAIKSAGPMTTVVQSTSRALKDLAAREKGLIGEHVVDFHELRRLGGSWPHDSASGAWSPTDVRKLNADRRPVNLSLNDLPRINQPGLDAVWQHGAGYTVTEAKASESVAAAYAFGKYKEKKGLIPTLEGLSPDLQLLHYLLSDASDKDGSLSSLTQMGNGWVKDRVRREGLSMAAQSAVLEGSAQRHVALVTVEASGIADHAQALCELHLCASDSSGQRHNTHGLARRWDANAIDVVDFARRDARKAKAGATPTSSPQEKPSRIKRNRQ